MRQNLTNIAAKDLESLEHFYIVGSTTKEGLLDESTNVKIDLKKAVAGGGGDSETFDAKKFGDDLVKYIYPDLPNSTVFPDMYCVVELPDTFSGPPESDVELAATFFGAISRKVVVPLYSNVPSSDKIIIASASGAMEPNTVGHTQESQVEVDGTTYYVFSHPSG